MQEPSYSKEEFLNTIDNIIEVQSESSIDDSVSLSEKFPSSEKICVTS